MKLKIATLLFFFYGYKVVLLCQTTKSVEYYGVDNIVKDFLEDIHSYTGPPIQELPLDIARSAMENLQKEVTTNYNVEETIISIPVNEKHVKLVIVKPRKTKKKLPVLLYFHGGGWILNNYNTHKRLMADIVNETHIAIVFVEFSRSPEVKYPIANEEAYAATLWVGQQGEKFGLNPTKIAVGGDSAGGNMATVVSMMAKKRKKPNIIAQLLLYPVTDTNLNTPSYKTFSENHYLTRDAMIWFWDSYAPDKKTHSLPTVAPLQATLETLTGLPPALVITAEYDVLRDEGEAYAKKLRMAGVPVMSTRYGGTIHDFIVLNALKSTYQSKLAIQQVSSYLKSIFSKEKNFITQKN